MKLQVVIIALAMTLFVAKTSAVPLQSASESVTGNEEHKLQIISVTKERIEARFYTHTQGIHIVSAVRSNGEVARLSIASTQTGETVFAVDYPLSHSQGLLTINRHEFFIVNETLSNEEAKATAYSVPEDYSLQIKTEMKRQSLPKSMLERLDHDNVDTNARSAVEQLLVRSEVQLVVPAAFALGEIGIIGRNNPAAMVFYATALQFATMLDQNTTSSPLKESITPAQRNRRTVSDWLWGDYCPNSDSTCLHCPEGSNCLGLCGRGCDCWWIICFDCCWNIGCYLHDVYFCADGYTWQCWASAPVALVCS